MKKLTVAGVTLALCFGIGAAQAATFIVTSTADTDGSTCGSPCTLRQAINAANASVGVPDTINFNFSGIIALGSTLPVVTDTLTVDGAGRSVILSGGGTVQVLQVNSATALTLKSLTIADGRADSSFTAGGVTTFGAALNVTNCVFSGNTARGSFAAGAIVLRSGSLTVTNSRFSSNSGLLVTGEPSVGAIISFSSGPITIANSTFENNAGSTGAISTFSGSLMTVSGSTFAGNSASGSGGAISWGGMAGTLTNSTFYGNSAVFRGGAIYFTGTGDVPAQLTVTNSTFAGNSSNSGNIVGLNVNGAIFGTPNTTLRNTIVAHSTNGNCNTSVIDGGGNLSDDSTCAVTTATSLANAPAQLGPLQNNGGPTQTMAPLTGSSAINQGVNQLAVDAGLTTDQRGTGFPRISPIGGAVDRGALEVQVDNIPPKCTAYAKPKTLYKPDHKLVNITTSVAATDNEPGVTFKLRSVTSSEADSGLGRGDVPFDIQGWTVGSADLTGQLRNERYSKAGRVYTITYEAKDAAGNTASCSAAVTVPR